MKKTARAILIPIILLLCLCSCSKTVQVITMATTTSTENSGLLAYINPVFEKQTGIKVKVIALGTGAALQCGRDGNADLLLVHAREKEDQFVAEGYGTNRKDVMHNDFIIIGPQADPAGIRGLQDAPAALAKIAASRTAFVSRGDDSGTHFKEQTLWQLTDLQMQTIVTEISVNNSIKQLSYVQPRGDWYFTIGQGMGNTINFAYEKQGYTLADRGTWLAYRGKTDLRILCEGDPRLFNPYGIMAVNSSRHKHLQYESAMRYINWIVSPAAQRLIGNFTIGGEVLFFPDAADG